MRERHPGSGDVKKLHAAARFHEPVSFASARNRQDEVL